jgi:hypothetical protein
VLREPSAAVLQFLINFRRKNQHLRLSQESISSDEEESLDEIIQLKAAQMRGHFQTGKFQRGGNTKTHGLVRATVTVREDIPERMKKRPICTAQKLSRLRAVFRARPGRTQRYSGRRLLQHGHEDHGRAR